MFNYVINCKSIVTHTDIILQCVLISYDHNQWSTGFTESVGKAAPLFRKLGNSLVMHEIPASKLSCAQPLQAKQRLLTTFSVIGFNISLATAARPRKIVRSRRRFDLNVFLSSHPCVLLRPSHLFSQKLYTLMLLVKSANY